VSPRISVVIPTIGRPAALERCLNALGEQTLDPREIEIVVVGDGSAVAPPAPGAAGAATLVWRRQAHSGPAAARNLGVRTARAGTIAFTDDDCAPRADWAERLLAATEAHPRRIVGGGVVNGLPHRPWSAASHLMLDVVVDMYNGRDGRAGFAPTSNLAMRRDVFDAVGGFNEAFRTAAAEDREFCDRAHAAGHDLVLARDAVVDHFHDLDLRRYWRQNASYGRGEVAYRGACADHGRPINIVESGFFWRLGRDAFAGGRRRGLIVTGRLVAGQVAFISSFWATRARAAARGRPSPA
jgi:GT2 family glycosyltransferase